MADQAEVTRLRQAYDTPVEQRIRILRDIEVVRDRLEELGVAP